MNIVIIDCFDTWEHRVDLLKKVLVEDGHKITVLMSDYKHREKTKRTKDKDGFIFFSAEPYKKNISIARLHSHMQLSTDVFGWIEENAKSIDLIWVLVPPNSFVADAGRAKQKYPNIKLVIDLIDLWPESMPLGGIKPLLTPWRTLRNKNFQYADVIVTVCDLYKNVLGKTLDGKQVETLYLAREDKGYNPHLCLPKDKLNLVYLGSINNIIDIDVIGKIITKFRNIKPVKLIIIGDGEKREKMIRAAENAGAEVEYKGVVYDRDEKQRIFDSCHYGLNVMKELVCVGLTMKSIDYFEFGLPIINNIHGDTWDIIDEYMCGYNFSLTDETFNIESYLKKNMEQRRIARNFFENYLTYDLFIKKVKKIVNSCD